MSRTPSDLVEQSFRFAVRAHRDQTRKGSDLPYFCHPAAVALILAQHGFDQDEILAAALLHDCVEDTSATMEQIRNEFPLRVAELVDLLSERKRDSRGEPRPWAVRKQEQRERIAKAPRTARAIALADLLHNLSSMQFDLNQGINLWSRFNAEPPELFTHYRQVVAAASQEDEELRTLRSECETLINHLSEAYGRLPAEGPPSP